MRNIKLRVWVWRVLWEGRAVLKEDTKYCSARGGLFASVALGQGGSKHTDLRGERLGSMRRSGGQLPRPEMTPRLGGGPQQGRWMKDHSHRQ